MKNIFITGIGGDIGQSVITCVRKYYPNIQIVGCDIDPYAAGQKKVNSFYVVPRVIDRKKYKNAIHKIVKKHHITHIFPITEPEIRVFDSQRAYFKKKGIIVFINSHVIIHIFLNKLRTIKFLKKHQLPYPASYMAADKYESLPFPLIAKPQEGYGAKGNVIINDQYDFQYVKTRMPHAVLQEIVGSSDEEYTVGVFSDGNQIYSIAMRRYLGYGSLTKIAHLVHDEKINILINKIAKIIKLKGFINVQLRKAKNEYKIIEINPRISSTVYMRHCFGFTDLKWWIDMCDKKKILYKSRFTHGTAVRTVGVTLFNMRRGA